VDDIEAFLGKEQAQAVAVDQRAQVAAEVAARAVVDAALQQQDLLLAGELAGDGGAAGPGTDDDDACREVIISLGDSHAHQPAA
jgi:hypothetical protein